MALSPNINSREFGKFRDAGFDGDNQPQSRVAVDVEKSESYKTIIDEINKNLSYVGDASPGSLTSSAIWRVRRIQTVGSVTTVSFADGNSNFDNIWDNRLSLTYS